MRTNLKKVLVNRRQHISCGLHFCRGSFYKLLNYLGKVQLSLFVSCLATFRFQIDSGLYMHVKFTSGATPKRIQLIMNVDSIGRKQIAAHLQVQAYCFNKSIYTSHIMNYSELIQDVSLTSNCNFVNSVTNISARNTERRWRRNWKIQMQINAAMVPQVYSL